MRRWVIGAVIALGMVTGGDAVGATSSGPISKAGAARKVRPAKKTSPTSPSPSSSSSWTPSAPAPVPAAPMTAAPPAIAPSSPPPAEKGHEPSTSASSPTLPVASSLRVAPPGRDTAQDVEPPPRHFVTIGLNPLPLIAGRYGLNVELVPFRHHAIVASGYLQTFTPAMLEVIMPKAVETTHGADARLGGEIGYRFYSGSDGADGFFAGVSGVAMPLVYPRVTSDFRAEAVSFLAYGGALDVGVQAITSSGFTIGGGLGVMYLAWSPPVSAGAGAAGVTVPSFPEPHVLPRLLLAAGWSF